MVASDRPRPNAIAIFQVFICSPPGGFGCRAIRSPSCRHAPTGNSHKDTKAQRKKRMRGAVAGFPLSRYSLEGWRIRSLQDGPHPAGTGTPEALMRNGGRHRCQPPLSGFIPVPSIRFIPARFSCDRRSAKRGGAAGTGTIRRRFGRPPCGGRPHLENPSSSCPSFCRNSRSLKAMDCFPDRSGSLQLVGIAAFRDRVSVHVLVDPVRFLPVGLATTLRVPAVRRLCRPIMGSWHEAAAPPTEKAHKTGPHSPRLWISPALATSGFRTDRKSVV